MLRGFARTFGPGEQVVCGRCGNPDHLKLSREGITLVCDNTIGTRDDRRRCRQRHYVLSTHRHHAVVAIPRETYDAMREGEGVSMDRLWAAGVVQAAFHALGELAPGEQEAKAAA